MAVHPWTVVLESPPQPSEERGFKTLYHIFVAWRTESEHTIQSRMASDVGAGVGLGAVNVAAVKEHT